MNVFLFEFWAGNMLTSIGFNAPKKSCQPTHEKETTRTDNDSDEPKYRRMLLAYLLHYFNIERNTLRVEELDGVSGPCSGCASDVFTGYTQGIMGLPLAYSGGINIFSLNELINILYTVLSFFVNNIVSLHHQEKQSLEEILNIIIKNVDKLPDKDILSRIICGEKNLISIDNKLIDSLANYINEVLNKNNNYDTNVLKKVSESIIIITLIHNEVFTPGGLRCPVRVTGKLKLLKGTLTRKLPVLEIKIIKSSVAGAGG